MIQGYNIEFSKELYPVDPKAIARYREDEKRNVENLANYLLDATTIDANAIIERVFPTQKADIFLSHSRDDRDLAVQLAIDLQKNSGLSVFVDSCIWGSADDLLLKIDDLFCRDAPGQNYRYQDRNRTTAHVHMILASALQQMIDKADTLFFLNTDKSLSLEHSISGSQKTLSPWIHMELMFSSLVRRPPRPALEHAMLDAASKRSAHKVVHAAPLNHLIALQHHEFLQWIFDCSLASDKHAAIRTLYDRHPE